MQTCELCPWTDPVPWTPAMIRQFCNTSAAGLDGLPFDAFAALSDDILNLLCQLYDAFDAGLAFPSCWTTARLVCIQKPDGGTRPITILSAAYRIWGKRTAQNLATWTSWFPSQLVGGRPSGVQQARQMRFRLLSLTFIVTLGFWPVPFLTSQSVSILYL